MLCLGNRQTIASQCPIDFYHAAAVLHKHKTFCPSSLAVKNLKTSLDGQKKKLLFSWDLTWPPREKGLLPMPEATFFELGVYALKFSSSQNGPFFLELDIELP